MRKNIRIIILALICISLIAILYFLKTSESNLIVAPNQVNKYSQELNQNNAKCFLAPPKDQECMCLGVGCCGSSEGYYYDSKTDLCYKVSVENAGVPFKNLSECENICRTMIYERVGDSYVKISKNIYYIPTQNLLSGVDASKFNALKDAAGNNQEYGKDTSNVYYTNQKIELANSKNFLVLSARYGKDDKQIFYKNQIIEEVDYDSFEVLKDVGIIAYAKDKYHVYIDGKIFEIADSKTFQVLRYPYSKDKNNVFIFQEVVTGRDPASFK